MKLGIADCCYNVYDQTESFYIWSELEYDACCYAEHQAHRKRIDQAYQRAMRSMGRRLV